MQLSVMMEEKFIPRFVVSSTCRNTWTRVSRTLRHPDSRPSLATALRRGVDVIVYGFANGVACINQVR